MTIILLQVVTVWGAVLFIHILGKIMFSGIPVSTLLHDTLCYPQGRHKQSVILQPLGEASKFTTAGCSQSAAAFYHYV